MVSKSTFCTFTFESVEGFEADSCSYKLSSGIYYFYIVVDPNYLIDETNEHNNVAYLDGVTVDDYFNNNDDAQGTMGESSGSSNVLITLILIGSIFAVIGLFIRRTRGEKRPEAPYMIVSDAPTYNAEFNTNPLEQPSSSSGHINSVAPPPQGVAAASLYSQPVVTSTFNDHAVSRALDVMNDTEAATPNSPGSTEERIKDLKILKDAEMIDDDTYQTKLNQIINDI